MKLPLDKTETLGGIARPDAYVAVGFLMALSHSQTVVLNNTDRRILQDAHRALFAALTVIYEDGDEPTTNQSPGVHPPADSQLPSNVDPPY